MTDAVPCDAELDASGLNCPLPLLKAKMELNRLGSGAVLKVVATDAGSQRSTPTGSRKPEPFSLRITDVQSASWLAAPLFLG